ncbi:MAG: hypothetical protein V1749_07910 [Candidatus Desantisbacteria bacterium]
MPKKTSVSGVEIPPHEYGKVAKLLNEKLRFPMNQHNNIAAKEKKQVICDQKKIVDYYSHLGYNSL